MTTGTTALEVCDLHNVHKVISIAEVGLYRYKNQVTLTSVQKSDNA